MSRPKPTRRELLLGICGAGAALGLAGGTTRVAGASARDTLRLAFLTDVHARPDRDVPRALEQTAGAINASRPELIVAGGDLITEGFNSRIEATLPRWQAYLEFQRSLKAPVAPVIGNHDLVGVSPADGSPASEDPKAQFRHQLGRTRTYYSFDAAGYRIVVLDSIMVGGGELEYQGRIDAEQLRWLRQSLRALDPGTPIVVALHMPVLTGFFQATEGATAAAPANRVLVNSLELLELFGEHDLVLVLQGHLHVAELLRWRSTTLVTGGAVCGRWWDGPWHGTRPGFGLVTLRPDRVDWEYVACG